MALIGALILIWLLGYLAQSIGLCMVRGVKELRAGKPEFLLAILCSGVLAWVAALAAELLGIPLKFRAYEFSSWFVLGGLLFGLGASVNQGCGVSTLLRLTRGEMNMIATAIGWLVGWTILASWKPQTELTEKGLPENLTYLILVVSSIGLSLWAILGDKNRRKLWFGMMGIGLLAGFIFLFEPRWPPSGLLQNLSNAAMGREQVAWPTVVQYLLFIFLLLGMLIAAWQAKTFSYSPSGWKTWLLHIAAGTLMGIGGSLAVGGNDSQLLLALPTLSLAAMGAVFGIVLGIWLGLYIQDKLAS